MLSLAGACRQPRLPRDDRQLRRALVCSTFDQDSALDVIAFDESIRDWRFSLDGHQRPLWSGGYGEQK